MYVSREVRALRDDPIPGETVGLLLRVADDTDTGAVVAAVRRAGGEIDDRLPFGDLRATVAHGDLDAVCAVDGLAAVETDNVLAMDLDGAGEDVDY